MRKYIIGMLVGGALTFAVQAGAASLLDSKINAVIEVEVDGESLGQAPVINGVSYLPVRKFGDAVGYNVNFREGKATLTSEIKPEGVVPTEPVQSVQSVNEQPLKTPLEEIEELISATIREQAPYSRESGMLTLEAANATPERMVEIESRLKEIATLSKPLTEKLEDLYKQKSQLEAQQ